MFGQTPSPKRPNTGTTSGKGGDGGGPSCRPETVRLVYFCPEGVCVGSGFHSSQSVWGVKEIKSDIGTPSSSTQEVPGVPPLPATNFSVSTIRHPTGLKDGPDVGPSPRITDPTTHSWGPDPKVPTLLPITPGSRGKDIGND